MSGPRLVARLLAVGFGLALVAAAIAVLRDETISEHVPQDPDSRLEVVLRARTHRAETGQGVREIATAKVAVCRTEIIRADPITPLRPVAGTSDTFSVILSPSLDDADRVQFVGCMEDWNLDQILVDVVELRELGVEEATT